jgi:hypothetical protein
MAPRIALVCKPVEVVSGGSAWYARNKKYEPSTKTNGGIEGFLIQISGLLYVILHMNIDSSSNKRVTEYLMNA